MSRTQPYHHGDLRQALLLAAQALVREEGIERLSLRKLSERVGVSRMAPYHHFEDKHRLLCALAAAGFQELSHLIEATALSPGDALESSLYTFVNAYLQFALSEPERYELMFGRPIWKTNHPTDELKSQAYTAFRRYAEKVAGLMQDLDIHPAVKPLRIAQASWATLHGLCRLQIDGIYINPEDMTEVSNTAVRLFISAINAQHAVLKTAEPDAPV